MVIRWIIKFKTKLPAVFRGVRQKLLEKGDTLTLRVVKTAVSYEDVQAQLESVKSKTTNVNQIRDSHKSKHRHKGKMSGENKKKIF